MFKSKIENPAMSGTSRKLVAHCAPSKILVSPGFTLVEAVIALAILSIGIFVIIEATARCLAVIRSSRNYQTARTVLDRGEAEFPLQSTNAVEDNTVAATEYEPGYSFERELEEVDGEKKLYVVKTRVTWSESGQGSVEELVSYLYFPNEE
ncbi:MAG: prepilin-type N-terminal cleavage/methylation domain-containing protein [Lentisphaerae bacterium]|nr:prepilin-type N-terminal cleavage/methylation domain-containing protein [Lentisphaerota bacterium]